MYIENRRQYSWPGSAFFPRFLGNRTPLLLFSRNLVLKSLLFSINVVRKWAMFFGQAIYVLGPLQLRKAGTRALLGAVKSPPRGQAPQRSSA